jgi:hypothetical protein
MISLRVFFELPLFVKIIGLESDFLELSGSGELNGFKDSATNRVDPEPVFMNEKARINFT